MSIDLGTVSSAVVNGRCTGCGRFIARNTSHFHSPPRKFRGAPRAHLYDWDGFGTGGMVTRCDDPAQARPLLIAKYRRIYGYTQEEAEQVFPEGRGEVQRGRVNPNQPGGDYSWHWERLPDRAKGPGVTTAVVWSP